MQREAGPPGARRSNSFTPKRSSVHETGSTPACAAGKAHTPRAAPSRRDDAVSADKNTSRPCNLGAPSGPFPGPRSSLNTGWSRSQAHRKSQGRFSGGIRKKGPPLASRACSAFLDLGEMRVQGWRHVHGERPAVVRARETAGRRLHPALRRRRAVEQDVVLRVRISNALFSVRKTTADPRAVNDARSLTRIGGFAARPPSETSIFGAVGVARGHGPRAVGLRS